MTTLAQHMREHGFHTNAHWNVNAFYTHVYVQAFIHNMWAQGGTLSERGWRGVDRRAWARYFAM